MTRLSQRKTRLVFKTSAEVRSAGRYRRVVVEAHPEWAAIRLHGTRQRLLLTWEAIHDLAAKMEANRLAAEKKAARKSPRSRAS